MERRRETIQVGWAERADGAALSAEEMAELERQRKARLDRAWAEYRHTEIGYELTKDPASGGMVGNFYRR